MEHFLSVLETYGFQTMCCIALGWFCYTILHKVNEQNEERENKLYEMLLQTQATNQELISTNSEFVEVLKHYNDDLNVIKQDVQTIRTYFDKQS